jgi:hypothetical protein
MVWLTNVGQAFLPDEVGCGSGTALEMGTHICQAGKPDLRVLANLNLMSGYSYVRALRIVSFVRENRDLFDWECKSTQTTLLHGQALFELLRSGER